MGHVITSLRSRLIILVLLAVLPAFVVIIHSGIQQRELAYRDVESDLRITLRLVSAKEEAVTEGASQWLKALALHPDMVTMDSSRCSEFVRRMLDEHGPYVNLGVRDARGNLVCSAIPFSSPENAQDQTYVQRAFETQQFFVREYEIQPSTGIASVCYSQLVVDAKGELAAIFAEQPLAWFYELAANAEHPPDTTITLIDQKGTVVARYPNPKEWVGKVCPEVEIIKTIMAREEGNVEAEDIDGIRRLHVFTRLKGAQPGGFVCASTALNSVHASANEILLKNLLALAGVTLLVLAGAWLYGHLLIVRSVNLLLDLAHKLGQGELSARSGLRRKDGEFSKLASAFDDMAESLQARDEQRSLAEESLHRSEENFRSLVENSPTGISIIQDHMVVYVNPEHERLSERPFVQSRRVDFEGIHPDDLEEVRKLYNDLASGRIEQADLSFRFQRLSEGGDGGTMKWLYCRANTIQYMGRKAILINMTDITRIKEMEHLLGIQDRMASLGRVTAGIAHELRNPLSGINIHLTNLERICSSLDRERMQKAIDITGQLKNASNRIESVIRRVLDFSKPGALKFVTADVNHIIDESIELCAATLRKGEIDITKSPAPDLPGCLVDPSSLQQALMNLITNAINTLKNWDGPRRVEVSSEANESHILIKVADSGPGIPSHLTDRVFEPFFTTQKDGLGIGLSICHRIVSDHGGSLKVSPSRWGGAEFTIEIPRRSVEKSFLG